MISKTPGENKKGHINGKARGVPLLFAVHTLYFLDFKIKDFTFFVMFYVYIGLNRRNVGIVSIMYDQA